MTQTLEVGSSSPWFNKLSGYHSFTSSFRVVVQNLSMTWGALEILVPRPTTSLGQREGLDLSSLERSPGHAKVQPKLKTTDSEQLTFLTCESWGQSHLFSSPVIRGFVTRTLFTAFLVFVTCFVHFNLLDIRGMTMVSHISAESLREDGEERHV